MTKVVTYNFRGETYYLSSTVWTSSPDRATRFNSDEDAKAALMHRHKVLRSMNHPVRQLKDEAITAQIVEA